MNQTAYCCIIAICSLPVRKNVAKRGVSCLVPGNSSALLHFHALQYLCGLEETYCD